MSKPLEDLINFEPPEPPQEGDFDHRLVYCRMMTANTLSGEVIKIETGDCMVPLILVRGCDCSICVQILAMCSLN